MLLALFFLLNKLYITDKKIPFFKTRRNGLSLENSLRMRKVLLYVCYLSVLLAHYCIYQLFIWHPSMCFLGFVKLIDAGLKIYILFAGILFFALGNCLNFVSFGYAAQVSFRFFTCFGIDHLEWARLPSLSLHTQKHSWS